VTKELVKKVLPGGETRLLEQKKERNVPDQMSVLTWEKRDQKANAGKKKNASGVPNLTSEKVPLTPSILGRLKGEGAAREYRPYGRGLRQRKERSHIKRSEAKRKGTKV